MVIELPDIGLTEQEVRQDLAVALFQQSKASLAKAARVAGITRLDFQRLLASRQIAVHYTERDWEEDQRALDMLAS